MVKTKRNKILVGKHEQQGAILVTSLIFLLILTLMAVSGMEATVVEERMAGNMQDYNQAFQAAEVALDEGEAWLADLIDLPLTSADGTTTVWVIDGPDPDSDNDDWWKERDAAWWTANAEDSANVKEVLSQPQYLIEEFHTTTEGQSLAIGTGEISNTRVIHRITSRGVGPSGNAQVLLQSTYIRPYD